MERYALRSGRYYQDDLISLLVQEVRRGETFVDIGANLGFVTLTAAKVVGPEGRVIAVEANPVLTQRLRQTLERNDLRNVEVHNVALGDRAGEVTLVTQGHHGTSHIAPVRADSDRIELKRGDDLLGDLAGPVFVKIDVEGAEQAVIDGLATLLGKARVRWLVEICEEHLARFDATPARLFETMGRFGYSPYLSRLSPISGKVRLRPLPAPLRSQIYDVLFVRSEAAEPNAPGT